MSTIPKLIKAAARVVHAHREAKRAHADGSSAEAQKRYQKAVIAALDELDPLVVAAMREANAARESASKTPFDWNGVFRAVTAGLKIADRMKGASPGEVAQIIDAEVLGAKDAR